MNTKQLFVLGLFMVAIGWSQGSNKGVRSYTYKLKEQDGSFTRMAKADYLSCAGIINSNASPASHSTPWKFSIYVMNSTDFKSSIRPKGIGTWTSSELDLIDKAIQYWNNSGARVLLEKIPASKWNADYGDAVSASKVHSYTMVKAVNSVYDESGAQVFPASGASVANALGLTIKPDVFISTPTMVFTEGSISDGTNVTGVIMDCDPISKDKKSYVEKCLRKKPGCSTVLLKNNQLDPSCVQKPKTISNAAISCNPDPKKTGNYNWSCFVKSCADVFPDTNIPNYDKCIDGLASTICPAPENISNNTIIIDFRSPANAQWAMTPSDIYEATPKWTSNTEPYLNMDKNSFLTVVIHELGHYLGLNHDNALYDVHEPAVTTPKSMKEMALESFNVRPVFVGQSPRMRPSLLLYAHSGLDNTGPSYVGPDGNVYRLELKDKTYSEPNYKSVTTKNWEWVPSAVNSATVIKRAQRRFESIMSTDENQTKEGYEVPKYLMFNSYLAYGDECLLTSAGCGYSKTLNVGYYPAFFDLNKAYSANASSNHFESTEK